MARRNDYLNIRPWDPRVLQGVDPNSLLNSRPSPNLSGLDAASLVRPVNNSIYYQNPHGGATPGIIPGNEAPPQATGGSIADLFGGGQQAPLPGYLEQAMGQVNSNIAQLLAQGGMNAQPSVYDLGQSILRSAATGGQVSSSQILQQEQVNRYQTVAAQAGLVSQAFQMHLEAAKAKSAGNPMADFYAKQMEQIMQEDPVWAQKIYDGISTDPRPFSPELFSEYLQKTRPQGKLNKIEQDQGENTLSAFQDEYGNIVESPLTGEKITTAPRKTSDTNVSVSVANTLGSNEAGKAAGAAIAKRMVQDARNELFPKGVQGPVDRGNLITGSVAENVPGAKVGMQAIGVGEKGIETRRKLNYAARQGIRIVSGAVISQEEIDTEYPLVIPGALESEEGIRNKLDLMEVWFDTTERMMKGGMEANAAVAAAYDEVYARRGGGKPTPTTSKRPTDEELDKMSLEELQKLDAELGK